VSPRALALPLALFLGLSLTLTACGDDSTPAVGADAVHVSGDVGKAPQVTFSRQMSGVTTVSDKTLVEGDGAQVAEGDKIDAQIWIGNGFSKQKAYSTYDSGSPQTLTVDSKNLSKVFLAGLLGHTIGSRVLVTGPASAAFGSQGNPQIGIGNKDPIAVVVDIIDEYTPPKPKDVKPSALPTLVEKKGDPTGFDFAGVDKPQAGGDLLRVVLKEGKGATVTQDMTVTADYLGEVYGAKKPFDESYSKKPVDFPLSNVVQGWTYGLDGLKVGSRVLLQIPPDLGYGAQGQPSAGIPANATLYFVIDIVKAK
jgi:peptidylprolyl isomerase